jgi:putative transposase
MAQHDDALPLSELLATAGGEGIKDLLREVVRDALQGLIEEELTAAIGAARHERTETRTAQRNGSRDRLVSTRLHRGGRWRRSDEHERCG